MSASLGVEEMTPPVLEDEEGPLLADSECTDDARRGAGVFRDLFRRQKSPINKSKEQRRSALFLHI